MKRNKTRILVIGWDGADFSLLSPLLAEGRLPQLKKLISSGHSVEMATLRPPVSPTIWSSMVTGLNPGKTGIFGWEEQRNKSYRFERVHAGSLKKKRIWDIVAEAGISSVVVGVPLTAPVRPIRGVMVGGFSRGERGGVYPPDKEKELADKFGPWQSTPLKSDFDSWMKIERQKERYFSHLIDTTDYGFAMVVFRLIDVMNHRGKDFSQVFEACRFLDSILERIIKRADRENDLIFLVSDHGSVQIKKILGINQWLFDQGYLCYQPALSSSQFKEVLEFTTGFAGLTERSTIRRLAVPVSHGIYRLLSREKKAHITNFLGKLTEFTLLKSEIDWSRTTAFSRGLDGQVYLNTQKRFSHGILSDKKAAVLCDEIRNGLLKIIDPQTGAPIIQSVPGREEIYHGPATKNAPDLICITEPCIECLPGVKRGRDVVRFPSRGYIGGHSDQAILIASGPGIARGKTKSASITDLAPTWLYALGAPVPNDMDGRVIGDIWQHPPSDDEISYSDLDMNETSALPSPSGSEKEAMVRELKSLGYLE